MKDSCTRTGRPRIARDVSSCQMVVILATLYVETYQFDLDPQVAEQKATQILVAFFGIDHAVSKMSAPWTSMRSRNVSSKPPPTANSMPPCGVA
jgi:hypothetical protein